MCITTQIVNNPINFIVCITCFYFESVPVETRTSCYETLRRGISSYGVVRSLTNSLRPCCFITTVVLRQLACRMLHYCHPQVPFSYNTVILYPLVQSSHNQTMLKCISSLVHKLYILKSSLHCPPPVLFPLDKPSLCVSPARISHMT